MSTTKEWKAKNNIFFNNKINLAQKAFYKRASLNSLASKGEYDQGMEG